MGTRQFLITITTERDIKPENIAYAIELAQLLDLGVDALHVGSATPPWEPIQVPINVGVGYAMPEPDSKAG